MANAAILAGDVPCYWLKESMLWEIPAAGYTRSKGRCGVSLWLCDGPARHREGC